MSMKYLKVDYCTLKKILQYNAEWPLYLRGDFQLRNSYCHANIFVVVYMEGSLKYERIPIFCRSPA